MFYNFFSFILKCGLVGELLDIMRSPKSWNERMKRFEELGSKFSVPERVVTAVVRLVWGVFAGFGFFFPTLKIQLNVGVSEEVYSYHSGTGYRLLPLSLNFS